MSNISAKSIFFILMLLASNSILLSSDAENIFNRKAESVVKITTFNQLNRVIKNGSGVILGKSNSKLKNDLPSRLSPERSKFVNSNAEGTDIISNLHVIAFASKIIVESKSGKKSEAGIVYFNSENDIAILRTASEISQESSQIASKLSIGQKVFAIGNPSGLDWSISDGIISGFRTNKESEVIQFTAPISAGSSGGGLFDSDGNLIGITTSQIHDAQNLNFAINLVSQKDFENEIIRKGQTIIPSEIGYRNWAIGYLYFDKNENDNKYQISKNERHILWDKYENAIGLIMEVNNSDEISGKTGIFSQTSADLVLSDAVKFIDLERSSHFEYDIIHSPSKCESDQKLIEKYVELKKKHGSILCLENAFLFDRSRILISTQSDASKFENEMVDSIIDMPLKSGFDSEINKFVSSLKMICHRFKLKNLESVLKSKGY